MRTQEEIEKMQQLDAKTFRRGSWLSTTMLPADAFDAFETLRWVLGDKESMLNNHFEHNGRDVDEWLAGSDDD